MWSFTVLCVLCVTTVLAKEIGDKCVPNNVVAEGRCVLVIECDEAIRSIMVHRTHPFARCGFEGLIEVVCCPTEVPVLPQPRTTARPIAATTRTSLLGEGLGSQRFGDKDADNTQRNLDITQRIADRECQKIIDSIPPSLGIHIIDGEAVEPGEFPHMVALGYNRSDGYEFLCGGSLISSSFVLTAAHCVATRDKITPAIVRMNAVDITGSAFNEATDRRVAASILHPKYRSNKSYHDIALLRLETAVQFEPYLYPACLYTSDSDPQKDLIVTGWGKTNASSNTRSRHLLKAKVAIVQNDMCRNYYNTNRRLREGIVDDQLCAGDEDGIKDTCQGDSGGPLQGFTGEDSYYRVVGVTSFGRSCGGREPGVYARVSRYLDWIESQVWPN